MGTPQGPSSSRPPDPFELWRQIYETNERAWSAVLERTVNNPAFAESTGKILETFLSAQKTVRENMRSYLEQINLPTREDIARLGEHSGMAQVFRNRMPCWATTSIAGVAGGVSPP